jgi:hypothetical protein
MSTSCSTGIRLNISTTKASGADCGVGNLNCTGSDSAVICCDEKTIGPRPNRKNLRSQIHDYILLKLGAPALEIELDEQNLDVAIDEALDVWEDYAPKDFYQYYTFQTIPGKSVYEMPPDVGHIRGVHYKEMANFAFQASDLDGAIPVEYFYPGGAYSSIQGGLIDPIQPIFGRMGEWTLYKQYEQMYSRISSNLGGWEFVGGHNHIKLYPIPCKPQYAIVHYLQKCKDWECNIQAIREGALASAMIMVGHIRSKFQNIPGPQGGTVLNGQDMLQRGQDMWDKWEERLIYRYGDILPIFVG